MLAVCIHQALSGIAHGLQTCSIGHTRSQGCSDCCSSGPVTEPRRHDTHAAILQGGRRPRVLVSNDDGVGAPGLRALAAAIAAAGFADLLVCGPASEQSAQVTVFRAFRVVSYSDNGQHLPLQSFETPPPWQTLMLLDEGLDVPASAVLGNR